MKVIGTIKNESQNSPPKCNKGQIVHQPNSIPMLSHLKTPSSQNPEPIVKAELQERSTPSCIHVVHHNPQALYSSQRPYRHTSW